MIQVFLFGVTAGVILSTGLYFNNRIFPSHFFGWFPLIFSVLCGIVYVLNAPSPMIRLKRDAQRSILYIVGIIGFPVAAFLLYLLTGRLAFISQEPEFFPLLFLTAWYLLIAGIPLALLGEAFKEKGYSSGNSWTGMLLFGTAIGVAGHFSVSESVDFRIVSLVSAALAAVLILFSKRRKTAPAQTQNVQNPAFSIGKRPKRASNQAFLLTVSGIVALLGAYWFFYVSQRLFELTLSASNYYSFLIPGILVSLGAGISLGGQFEKKKYFESLPLLALLGVSLSIGVGVLRLNTSLFGDIYSAYYAGKSTDFIVMLFSGWAFLLPAFLLGLFIPERSETVSLSRSSVFSHRLILPKGIALGCILYIVFPDVLSLETLAIVLGATLFVYAFIAWLPALRNKKSRPLNLIFLALFSAPILLTAIAPEYGIKNLFNPTMFMIKSEVLTPAGRHTLLQARNYDDPFLATIWNHTAPLTQDSRNVHNALYRMGHLPMLMHPSPQKVLVLGLGSGIAIEAVKMHRPGEIVCVEPSAAMIMLADSIAKKNRMPSRTNGVVLHTERLSSFISRNREKYDVIIAPEPFATPFKMNDIFSSDYYARIAQNLAEGGVFAQWIPLPRVTLDELKSVIAAIVRVFPASEMWIANADAENSMICIFGSNQPFSSNQPSNARFETLMKDETVAFHLATIGLSSWTDLLSEYGMDRSALLQFSSNAEAVSFFSPRVYGAKELSPDVGFHNISGILQMRSRPARILETLNDSMRAQTMNVFEDRPAILRANAAVVSGDDTTAVRILFDITRTHPRNAEARVLFSDVLTRRSAQFIGEQQYQAAIPLLNQVIYLAPLNTLVLRLLMIASMQTGDKQTAGLAIDGLKRMNPKHAGFRDNQATIRAQQGALEDALLLYENAITLDPLNEEFYCNMASVQYNHGHIWEAFRILDRASEKSYYPAKAFYLKGNFYANKNRWELALKAYQGFLRSAVPDDPRRSEVMNYISEIEKMKR